MNIEQQVVSPRTLRGGGYDAIHKWLTRHFGKADKCESVNCKGNSVNYHYALIDGEKHEHKRENYIMLCASCHRIYDQRPEWHEKQARTKRGRKLSPEHIERIKQSCQGINKGNKNSARQVCQLTLDGDLVKIWDCIKDAAREIPISSSSITMCCRGQAKTAGGYKWTYPNKL